MKKLLLLILLMSPAAFGQATKPEVLTSDESNILGQLLAIELESGGICSSLPATCKDKSQELATLYAQVAKSPRLIRALAAEAVFKYQRIGTSTKSAMQVSQIVDQQNAKLIPLLVLQNQRIIELLEQIAKKPK